MKKSVSLILFLILLSLMSISCAPSDADIIFPEDYYPRTDIFSPEYNALLSVGSGPVLITGRSRTGQMAGNDTIIETVFIQIGREANHIPVSVTEGEGSGIVLWEKEIAVTSGMWNLFAGAIDSAGREQIELTPIVFHVGYKQLPTPDSADNPQDAALLSNSFSYFAALEQSGDQRWYRYVVPVDAGKPSFFTTNHVLNGDSLTPASLVLKCYASLADAQAGNFDEVSSNTGSEPWPEITLDLTGTSAGTEFYFEIEYLDSPGKYAFGIK